jgi:DNA mismatch endonuclease, patch repair protein
MTAAPRYDGLRPASPKASKAAKGASKKRDTRPEVMLRRALWRLGLRYKVAPKGLPGRPDVVLARARVVIFCDGDFWHGRDLETRVAKLTAGHNAPYWVAKIRANVERDRRHDAALAADGWDVLRFWEKDILADVERCTLAIAARIAERRSLDRTVATLR